MGRTALAGCTTRGIGVVSIRSRERHRPGAVLIRDRGHQLGGKLRIFVGGHITRLYEGIESGRIFMIIDGLKTIWVHTHSVHARVQCFPVQIWRGG